MRRHDARAFAPDSSRTAAAQCRIGEGRRAASRRPAAFGGTLHRQPPIPAPLAPRERPRHNRIRRARLAVFRVASKRLVPR
ncbi:hypothetical protein WS70_00455 [Burkholderia mayonis]|uniref:Uncharacterized protein n=1 Tax=Burkholderia mayonis TaxID=1385591 RepID=A0A1B4F9Y1_9BURK|nr:hypothetical protein WS70_00455 [Burkholderia mayonis]KVE35779.1 hypothetical protein WS69_14145 [Burkholderia sp. BDU5]KVE43372.1 hypothetical protein WS70_09440 [Burkholderia mayonis]